MIIDGKYHPDPPKAPRHITTVPRAKIVLCHRRLDISLQRLLSGRDLLYIKGEVCSDPAPAKAFAHLLTFPDKQLKLWAWTMFKITL
jgi:hypothetical protein